MPTGKIKWFNSEKGYGFIEQDGRASDIFLHISDLAKTGTININPGEKVSFTIDNRKGKISAVDIKFCDHS